MNRDKQLILDFIHDLYDWLETSFLNKNYEHKWPIINIREELQEEASNAWLQFKKDYPKETFTRSIGQFKIKRLKAHGLYGAQLKYKFSTLKIVVEEALLGRPGWKRKLLDILDNLLESIGDNLPGMVRLRNLKTL